MTRLLSALLASLFATVAFAQNVGGSRVTDMPDASLPLSGSETIYIIQGGVSKKVTIDNGFGGSGSSLQVDVLTVTATNTLSSLSRSYGGNFIQLVINGISYTNLGPNNPFTVVGTVVSWNAGNAGFSLDTLDNVYVAYNPVPFPP